MTLRFRFGDFSRATRSHTLMEATAHSQTILGAGRELLAATMPLIERKGITLLGITLSALEDAGAVQLALDLERRHSVALETTLDDLRERFGASAVTPAVLLGRDFGPTVPLLPD